MARDLRGLTYKEMGEKYRNKVSKDEFKSRRREQNKAALNQAIAATPAQPRMAGDAVMDVLAEQRTATTEQKQAAVNERIMNMQQKQEAGKNINQAKLDKSMQFRDKLDARVDRQNEFDGNIDTFNYGSYGSEKAGLRDIEALSRAGYNAQEIASDIESKGIETTNRGNVLLSKYLRNIMEETPEPVVTPTPEPEPEPTPPPTINVVNPVIDTNVGGGGTGGGTPGGGNPGGGTSNSDGSGNDTAQVGFIGGDTGDVNMTDSFNYGTINTGIMNETNNYGGGYGVGQNNTGLAQQYIDLMQDNWEKYSGPGYGMFITDSRSKYASKNNPIDTGSIYGSMNKFAGNMYDRGMLTMGGLYGDPNKFTTPEYGFGFQDFTDRLKEEEEEKAS